MLQNISNTKEKNRQGINIVKFSPKENAKSRFASIASHELRTPIATIKGYTQILKNCFQNNQMATHYLQKLDAQTNRLATIVNDLLDVSKIQSGKLKLVKDKTEVDNLVAEVCEDLQFLTNHKLIICSQTKKMIFIDKDRIRQVLTNLIFNAIKYSPNSKKIIITLLADQKKVTISIKDFGIGISERDLKEIFKPFFQANNRIRQSFSGLGLGLFISAQIIKSHKGKIFAESQKSKGTTFTISLPT